MFKKVVLGSVLSVAAVSSAHAEHTSLQDAWVEAYQNNPSLEAARAKLRATDEQVAIALSHWRPSVDATSTFGKTYQYLPAQNDFGTSHFKSWTKSYGVQLTQPLFRGFRTLAETESAEKQVMAARAQLEATEQQLLLDTATAYLDVVRDEQIVKNNLETEDVLHKRLDETDFRARRGDLTQTDVRQSESRLARSEVSRLQAENTLNTDRDAFERLVGDVPQALDQPDLKLASPAEIDQAIHQAETRNPNVVAAQYAYDQSGADVDLNKGSLLPELNLVGSSSRSYGESTTTPGRFDSSQVLLQLTVPLYRSGADYAKIRSAQQTVVQRRMELEDARRKARESAHNAWQALKTATAAVKADNTEIDAAGRALEGVKVQSHYGTRNTLDVLNAEQELLDAKTDLARAKHDQNLAVLQIKAAIGELTADALKLPLEPYDPKKHYDNETGDLVAFGGADKDIYAKNYVKAGPDASALVVPVSDKPVLPAHMPAGASDDARAIAQDSGVAPTPSAAPVPAVTPTPLMLQQD